jgi:hypothetical protein
MTNIVRSDDIRSPLRIVIPSLIALTILCLNACATEIHQRIVTTNDVSEVRSDVQNDPSISDADKNAFTRAIDRPGYQPYGKTVAQIIGEEKKYDADVIAAEAALARIRMEQEQELSHDIVVRPKSVDVVMDGEYGVYNPYNDSDTLSFEVKSRANKSISAFRADITLTNEGGDALYSGTLEDANGIQSGGTATVVVHVTGMTDGADPQLIRATPVADVVLNYTVQEIRYSDGTRVDRVQ